MEPWKKKLIERAVLCSLEEQEQRRRAVLSRCLAEWRPYVLRMPCGSEVPSREIIQAQVFNDILTDLHRQATLSIHQAEQALRSLAGESA